MDKMTQFQIIFSDAVIHQSKMFLRAMLWGILFVAAYDCFRIFRRVIWHKMGWMAIEDLLFCVTGTVILYTLLFKYDYGAVRSYALFGISLGAAVYYFLVSRWFVDWFGRGLRIVFEKIMKFLSIMLKNIRKTGTIIKIGVQSKKHEKEKITHGNEKD